MKNRKPIHRILAWIGIVLLVAMYIITLILALIDHPKAQILFRGALYMTVMIPFLLYAFILVHKILTRNHDTFTPEQLENEDRND